MRTSRIRIRTARERDKESNLYFYRARYLDPKLGRFISADPIGLAGGINLYAYVGNNPIIYIDPLGLFTAKGFAGVIIGGVGAATKNPTLMVVGGAIVVWDWYESIQEAKKTGEKLGEELQKDIDKNIDTDMDGMNDFIDDDDDNDGVPDESDPNPKNPEDNPCP